MAVAQRAYVLMRAIVCALLPPSGHINLADVYLGYKRDRNYFIGLDSGAVAGYQLSGVVLGRNYKLPELLQVPATSNARSESNVLPLVQTLIVVPPEQPKADGAGAEDGQPAAEPAILSQLDPRQHKTITNMAKRGVNYISGTVCPAGKDMAKGQLESLAKAIEYYWKQTPDGRVILQTKWMGSRLQYFFFPGAPERCYSVSRNGFRKTFAPHIDAQLYAQVDKHLGAWCLEQDVDMVILDGELLPWAAMGEGLIQEHFQVAAVAAQTELETLQASGFEELCAEQNALLAADKESKTKLSQAEEVTRVALAQLKHTDFGVSITDKLEALQVYKRQLEVHGQPLAVDPATGETRVDYQAFSVLKYRRRATQEEVIPALAGESEIDTFRRVNGSAAHLVLDFKEFAGNLSAAVAAAQFFFDQVRGNTRGALRDATRFTLHPTTICMGHTCDTSILLGVWGEKESERAVLTRAIVCAFTPHIRRHCTRSARAS
jgi:hypothetical protein